MYTFEQCKDSGPVPIVALNSITCPQTDRHMQFKIFMSEDTYNLEVVAMVKPNAECNRRAAIIETFTLGAQ